MSYVAGDAIVEMVNTGQTGDTITAVIAQKPNGSPFSFTQTEVGTAGDYRIEFVTAVGEHGTWIFKPQSALAPGDYATGTYDVDASSVPVPIVPTVATAGNSLQSLRRRVGRRLGDLLLCTATSNGNTTTFYDNQHLLLPDGDYESWTAYVASGDSLNVGKERTITGSTTSGGAITVSPGFPAAILTGTVFELHNERGIGWTAAEKTAAINNAIGEAASMGGVEITVSPVPVFNQLTPTIAVPVTMTRLFLVEFQDVNDNWIVIPKANRPGAQGWWVHASASTIDVRGRWRYAANGRPIRLRGFGQFSQLVNETDLTTVNVMFIEARACLELLESGLDRDPARQGLIPIFQRDVDRWRRSATRVAPPNTTPVLGA